jgi:hypothetical protein
MTIDELQAKLASLEEKLEEQETTQIDGDDLRDVLTTLIQASNVSPAEKQRLSTLIA